MPRIQSLEAARAAAREMACDLLGRHRSGLARAVSPREVRAILGSSFDVARRELNKKISRKLRAQDLLDEAVREVIGGFVEERLAVEWEAENREAVRDASAYREAPPPRVEILRPPRRESPAAPVMPTPHTVPIIAVDEDHAEHTATRVIGAVSLVAGVGAFTLLSNGFRHVSTFAWAFGGGLAACGMMMLLFPKHVARNRD